MRVALSSSSIPSTGEIFGHISEGFINPVSRQSMPGLCTKCLSYRNRLCHQTDAGWKCVLCDTINQLYDLHAAEDSESLVEDSYDCVESLSDIVSRPIKKLLLIVAIPKDALQADGLAVFDFLHTLLTSVSSNQNICIVLYSSCITLLRLQDLIMSSHPKPICSADTIPGYSSSSILRDSMRRNVFTVTAAQLRNREDELKKSLISFSKEKRSLSQCGIGSAAALLDVATSLSSSCLSVAHVLILSTRSFPGSDPNSFYSLGRRMVEQSVYVDIFCATERGVRFHNLTSLASASGGTVYFAPFFNNAELLNVCSKFSENLQNRFHFDRCECQEDRQLSSESPAAMVELRCGKYFYSSRIHASGSAPGSNELKAFLDTDHIRQQSERMDYNKKKTIGVEDAATHAENGSLQSNSTSDDGIIPLKKSLHGSSHAVQLARRDTLATLWFRLSIDCDDHDINTNPAEEEESAFQIIIRFVWNGLKITRIFTRKASVNRTESRSHFQEVDSETYGLGLSHFLLLDYHHARLAELSPFPCENAKRDRHRQRILSVTERLSSPVSSGDLIIEKARQNLIQIVRYLYHMMEGPLMDSGMTVR